MDIAKSGIKDFERIVRRYGVDFAVTKDKSVQPPRYTVFFKAKDADALTSVHKAYSAKIMKKRSRPSVLAQLQKFKALAAEIPKKYGKRYRSVEDDEYKRDKTLCDPDIPYVISDFWTTNLGEAWRLAAGTDISEKILALFGTIPAAFGIRFRVCIRQTCAWDFVCGAVLRTAVYLRGKNAKKYRHNVEYGSARWSA